MSCVRSVFTAWLSTDVIVSDFNNICLLHESEEIRSNKKEKEKKEEGKGKKKVKKGHSQKFARFFLIHDRFP